MVIVRRANLMNRALLSCLDSLRRNGIDRSIPFRRRESKQLSKARFIRFARRTITIGLNPFWMLDAQGVVYLSLKLNVRADLVARRKSNRFHDVKNRL